MRKRIKINNKEVVIKTREPFAPKEQVVKSRKIYTRKEKHRKSM
jgi:hypothetical protein